MSIKRHIKVNSALSSLIVHLEEDRTELSTDVFLLLMVDADDQFSQYNLKHNVNKLEAATSSSRLIFRRLSCKILPFLCGFLFKRSLV